MATDTTTPQAAPDITPTQSPDLMQGLSGLAQPGPSVQGTSEFQQAQGFEQKAQEATQRAADLANQPITVPQGKHAPLMNLIAGIAQGFSAFGTSLATKGEKGGAQQVAEYENQKQQLEMQKQQQALNAKNQAISQQISVADTNHKMGQQIWLMANMPNEMAESDLKVKQGQQALAGGAQAQQITGADFQAAHGGMKPDEFSAALSTNAPAASGQGVNPFFVNSAKQQLEASTKVLGTDDSFVKNLQSTLADPKATPKDLWTATSQLASQQEKQSNASKQQAEQQSAEAGSPVGKLSTPEALAAPGAQAAIQAKIDDPTTKPTDLPRLRALLPQAAVAQFNAENIKQREARNTQIVNQGDPDAAGMLLANRSLTLDELKSRQVTPAFIEQATLAAQKYDPNFKAAESAGQSKIAGSATNQQFFGNTDSLLVKGGTLDQLETAGGNLGNNKLPVLNSIDNWRKAALGEGPQAAYAAAALGVADDYSKVMSGGTGSDTARLSALDIINKNLSPEGRAAAISQIRQAVESQRQGRVGTNPYLSDMYPDPAKSRAGSAPPGATHIVPGPDGKNHYTNAAGTVDLGVAP